MYYLVYFTKNKRGVEAMKESMWKVGRKGRYVFSDYGFVPGQRSILDYCEPEPSATWVGEASDAVYQEFKGEDVDIQEVKDYIVERTLWIWRTSILKELEGKGKIQVLTKRKRKGTYPSETRIRFL
jgi:hypothetical protein